MSRIKCPFCELEPFVRVDVGIGLIDTGMVECCEYGDMFFAQHMDYEVVKAAFIEAEGYEPPYKDTVIDAG